MNIYAGLAMGRIRHIYDLYDLDKELKSSFLEKNNENFKKYIGSNKQRSKNRKRYSRGKHKC